MTAVVTSPLNAATLYVVNHGWHTGLVIRRGDIPPGLWTEHAQAPPGEFLEAGWGEREFYQSRDPGLWLALRAALWPQASVLHLVGVWRSLFQMPMSGMRTEKSNAWAAGCMATAGFSRRAKNFTCSTPAMCGQAGRSKLRVVKPAMASRPAQ